MLAFLHPKCIGNLFKAMFNILDTRSSNTFKSPFKLEGVMLIQHHANSTVFSLCLCHNFKEFHLSNLKIKSHMYSH